MKKVLFMTAMLAVSLATAVAQRTPYRQADEPGTVQVHLMPKAGVTVSNFERSSGFGNVNSINGFTGGLALPVTFGRWFTIQPEMLYSEKGAELSTGLFGNRTRQTLKYLEIPVLARVNLGPLYVNAGPSVGFNLEPNKRGNILNGEGSPGSFTRADVGLQLGGGLALQAGTGKLTLDARYGLGLSDVSKFDGSLRNRSWAFTVGYAIPLSGR